MIVVDLITTSGFSGFQFYSLKRFYYWNPKVKRSRIVKHYTFINSVKTI